MAQRATGNATKVSGTTARTKGFQAPKDRGDTTTTAARNLQGQKPSYSSVAQVKQAAVNKGPMTDWNTSGQTMARTKNPPTPAKVSQQGQPRATQNTMRGSGSKKG